jgi:DNA-binding GntR family transcriptional regulator
VTSSAGEIDEPAAIGATFRELWEVVCAEIRNLIITGELAPGERLVEATLAARFGVSRGPVRTALLELERVGLVTSLARRGMHVATFERSDIDDLYDATMALELVAARAAAGAATPADAARLFELLDALDRAQHSGDRMAAVEADLELHRELMRTSGNRRMLQLWNQISEQIRFVIAVTHRALPDVAWANYNRPIIEAVADGDPDRAEHAVVSCFNEAHAEVRALSPEAFDRCTRRPAASAAAAG